jgi:predicted transglutaminase-like cysteine proteinase
VPISSQLRAAARLLAMLSLVGLCGDGAMARSVAKLQLALLSPVEISPQHAAPPAIRGPFGLSVSNDSPLSTRWRALQSVIRAETHVLAVCRSNPGICPPTAARFLAIVEAARALSGRARVGEINRAVNLAIRPVSDLAKFGVPDVWATPLMTFATGTGDCEDYAIAKFVALREAGMADENLRLMIVHDRQIRQDHAVVAAQVDGHWLILDNRTMILLTDAQVPNLTPLLALDSGNEIRTPILVATPQRQPGLALARRN